MNRFEIQVFLRGSKGCEVRFWWMDLGSSEFEVLPVKFEAVQSSFVIFGCNPILILILQLSGF